MPQLFPMNWLIISVMILFMIFIITINTFFIKMNYFQSPSENKTNKNKNKFSFKW
uniref:ATP synthase complex subunit 8 n=1 Tax=Bothriocroton concolor TaxID=65640 RepID=H9M725_BOTCN|nr:ATP synthase F0 subunit 8 [Bothriocroton concolor]AET63042.1 ATP synthase F0 subunit 8 [Bothriocroton concolor]